MEKHTPTPWKIENQKGKNLGGMIMQQPPYIVSQKGNAVCSMGGGSVFYENAEANAAFIIRAVNSHGELLAALKTARSIILHDIDETEADCCQIDNAIAKAEGK